MPLSRAKADRRSRTSRERRSRPRVPAPPPPASVCTAADFIPDVAADGAPARKKARSQFLGKAAMLVGLPPLPADAKLLRYLGDPTCLYSYCATALESRVKMDVVCERDLGIPIEAIDPNAYLAPEGIAASIASTAATAADDGDDGCRRLRIDAVMHPDDQRLLQAAESLLKAERTGPSSRRRESRTSFHSEISWLRRPEIMSTSLGSQRVSSRGCASLAKNRPLDPSLLVQAIDESFEHAKGTPKHSTKPQLQPVSILPVFPHFDISENKCSYVMFHRAPFERAVADGRDALANSVLHSSAAAPPRTKDLFVVPRPPSDAPRHRDTVEWCGRYAETSTSTAPDSKDRHFFLLTPSAAFYGDLESRESLKRVTKLPAHERASIPRRLRLAP